MGAAGPLVKTLAPAAAVAGLGLDVLGGLRTSDEAASVAGYNARVADADAKFADRETASVIELRTREARRLQARQRALFGISGFATAGSLVDIYRDTAEAAKLDALTIKYGGQTRSAKARAAAAWGRQRATQTREAGYLGAGTSLLAGAATTGRIVLR